MTELQRQQIQKHQSKISVIGDTLEARLNHLADLAKKLSNDGNQHLITAMDRYKQCGEVLLTAKAEIEAEKAKWRDLHWREKQKHLELKPKVNFLQYIATFLPGERTAYDYMAIAQGWDKYVLHECKTLTEALERMGKIKQRSSELQKQHQLEEKHQNNSDRLLPQFESEPVEKVVTKVEIKEIEKHEMVAQSKLDKVIAESQQLKGTVVDLTKQLKDSSKIQQVTVIDDSVENRAIKAEVKVTQPEVRTIQPEVKVIQPDVVETEQPLKQIEQSQTQNRSLIQNDLDILRSNAEDKMYEEINELKARELQEWEQKKAQQLQELTQELADKKAEKYEKLKEHHEKGMRGIIARHRQEAEDEFNKKYANYGRNLNKLAREAEKVLPLNMKLEEASREIERLNEEIKNLNENKLISVDESSELESVKNQIIEEARQEGLAIINKEKHQWNTVGRVAEYQELRKIFEEDNKARVDREIEAYKEKLDRKVKNADRALREEGKKNLEISDLRIELAKFKSRNNITPLIEATYKYLDVEGITEREFIENLDAKSGRKLNIKSNLEPDPDVVLEGF